MQIDFRFFLFFFNLFVFYEETKFKIYQYARENIACENRFIHQINDEESCIETEFQNSNGKRKRKQNSMINQDVKEVKEENELLEEIQNNYTKIHD